VAWSTRALVKIGAKRSIAQRLSYQDLSDDVVIALLRLGDGSGIDERLPRINVDDFGSLMHRAFGKKVGRIGADSASWWRENRARLLPNN